MASVEELLKEQEMANIHLELLQETRQTGQDSLLEAMLSNENLTLLNDTMINLSGSFDSVAKSFDSNLAGFSSTDSSPVDALVEDSNLAGFNFAESGPLTDNGPLILPSGEGNSSFITNNVESDEGSPLDELVDDSNDQVSLLSTISMGIGNLVEGAKDKGAKLLGIDRQKDGNSEGISLGKAGLIGLAVAGAAVVGKAIFDGFTDDKLIEKITGKAKDQLSTTEKAFSGIANALSVVSFGVFDATDTFSLIQPMAETVEKGMKFLFDPSVGVFAGFTNAISSLIDGNILDGVLGLGKSILMFPLSLFKMGEGIGNLLADLLPDSVLENIGRDLNTVVDAVMEFPTKIANAITGFVTNLTDSVFEKFSDLGSSLPFGLGKLFASDEEDATSTTSNTISKSKLDNLIQFPTNKDNSLGNAVVQKASGLNTPSLTPASNDSVDRTNQLSKDRMSDIKVIVQPTPPQSIVIPQEKRTVNKIVRRKESNDMTLAFMSAGNM